MTTTPNAPRQALTRSEAAATIGVSLRTFERHVQPQLKVVRVGRLRLFPVKEIERWVELHAAKTLEM